jgi:hypothetical protein
MHTFLQIRHAHTRALAQWQRPYRTDVRLEWVRGLEMLHPCVLHVVIQEGLQHLIMRACKQETEAQRQTYRLVRHISIFQGTGACALI